MGGLNSAQKKFLIILTIVTVISIVLTTLAYQLVPSLRPQTATTVTKTIIVLGSGYSPSTVTVPAGSTLIFISRSDIDHTVTQTNGTTFDKVIHAHGTITLKLTKPGTYQYDCTYHPFMVGTIIVQ